MTADTQLNRDLYDQHIGPPLQTLVAGMAKIFVAEVVELGTWMSTSPSHYRVSRVSQLAWADVIPIIIFGRKRVPLRNSQRSPTPFYIPDRTAQALSPPSRSTGIREEGVAEEPRGGTYHGVEEEEGVVQAVRVGVIPLWTHGLSLLYAGRRTRQCIL